MYSKEFGGIFTISVMAVDDEPAMLDITRLFLEREGDISVDCASSGQEALIKLREREYDVIVCDYMMPELDGIGFLKTVKTLGCETPIIIFTGKGREEVVIEALNYGAYSYLQKGEDPKKQFTRLRELIFRAVQRKKAEKDLIENLQRYRDVIENQTQMIYRFTPDGTLTFLNGPFCRHMSRNQEELMGKNVFELVYESDSKKLKEMIASLSRNHPSITLDLRTPAGGLIRWQRSEIHAIINREGRTIEFQVVGLDITEAKQVENVLKESEERLRALFNPSTDFIRVLDRVRHEKVEDGPQ